MFQYAFNLILIWGGGGGNDFSVAPCIQLFFALSLFALYSCPMIKKSKKYICDL